MYFLFALKQHDSRISGVSVIDFLILWALFTFGIKYLVHRFIYQQPTNIFNRSVSPICSKLSKRTNTKTCQQYFLYLFLWYSVLFSQINIFSLQFQLPDYLIAIILGVGVQGLLYKQLCLFSHKKSKHTPSPIAKLIK